MCRLVVVWLLTLPLLSARADEDNSEDLWVFPRSNGIPLRDKDGKEVLRWNTAAKATWTDNERVRLRLFRFPGPHEGYVLKTEVVKLADAEKYFSDKIRTNEKEAWAWRMRAQARSFNGEHDGAIEDLTRAIRLDPSSEGYSARGNALRMKGELEKAIRDYDEAIRLDPESGMAFNNRGSAWYVKKEFDKAIQDYSEAIRLDPNDTLALNNRAGAWHDKGDLDKAIQDYNEIIRIDSKYVFAFNNRGTVWYAKKEYDKAIADYDEAIRLDPEYAHAHFNRGEARYAKGDYDEAIADFTKLIQLKPKDAIAYGYVAWLLSTCPEEKLRDGKRAVEMATKACELTGWKDAGQLATLAAAYAEAGDFENAIAYQEKALKDDGYAKKEDAQALLNLYKLNLYKQKKPFRYAPLGKE